MPSDRDLHPIATLSMDLVRAVAWCRLGGGPRPEHDSAFGEAKALGLLAQDNVWRATEQGEGLLVGLGLLDGKPEPERALTVCLWARCGRYNRPQFVTAWSDGLDNCYPESAAELRAAAEREFAAFGDETGWEFWTTIEHLDRPDGPGEAVA